MCAELSQLYGFDCKSEVNLRMQFKPAKFQVETQITPKTCALQLKLCSCCESPHISNKFDNSCLPQRGSHLNWAQFLRVQNKHREHLTSWLIDKKQLIFRKRNVIAKTRLKQLKSRLQSLRGSLCNKLSYENVEKTLLCGLPVFSEKHKAARGIVGEGRDFN